MSFPPTLTAFVKPLRHLVQSARYFAKVPVQAKIPGLEPLPRPWYLKLLLSTALVVFEVVAGIAVGVLMLVVMHYLGFDSTQAGDQLTGTKKCL